MSLDDAVAALKAREDKAEREASLREQERQESLDRDRNRIRDVNTGWPTVREILANPTSIRAKEIIEGLGEPDREALQRIIDEWGAVRP